MVEKAIEKLSEIEWKMRIELKIDKRDLLPVYITDLEWKKLIVRYESLEKFSSLLTKRFQMINKLEKFS